jgi:trehalose 6-phosphate synthase/phosphatase
MAGAAKELGEAIIVNPTNPEEIADALHEALSMPLDEQQRRNRIMQNRLQRYDVTKWAHEFMEELEAVGEIQRKFYAKLLTSHTRRVISEEYRQAGQRLLFLDYDGTLVPFAPRPQLAKPTRRVMQLLQALSGDARNCCVIVSGRDRETLNTWFGDLPLALVAEHGVWMKEVNEDWKIQSQHSYAWKERIRSILELYADRLPGSFVEDKEHSVAFHYRTADPEQGPLLVGELMDHLVNFTANEDIQVLPGHKVLEVRNAGVNKGNAALHWLSRGSHDMVLAIGDDWTDEDLFGALPQSAYSIRVGITNTHARYNLRTSGEVVAFLEQLISSRSLSAEEVAVA